jgi:hypothetical protein
VVQKNKWKPDEFRMTLLEPHLLIIGPYGSEKIVLSVIVGSLVNYWSQIVELCCEVINKFQFSCDCIDEFTPCHAISLESGSAHLISFHRLRLQA